MTSRRLGLIAVLAVSVITPVLVAPISDGRVAGLVAHEWGTFTSVAGEDGRAVQWLPLEGPTDLPDFVNRIDCRLKGSLPGMVRMETPVIYFYAPREMTVNVNVRFRQGIITEWFPRPHGFSLDSTSSGAFRGEIAWTSVKVEPGGRDDFRVEREPNHYYVARETDAAPLSVGPERERFLFYRGVGRLPPHIAASVNADGQVVVSETRGGPLGDIILFENRDGAMAYQSLQTSSTSVTLNPLTVRANAPSPQKYLEQVLVARGLYPREAKAMVESWRGSWFEHGTRLFYIVSNEAVDTMLPLQIEPRPAEVTRVFVGRLEIATPRTLSEVKSALERNDRRVLTQYGRFLDPLAKRLMADLSPAQRSAFEERMKAASSPWTRPGFCGATTN
jgi:hypothetical protein